MLLYGEQLHEVRCSRCGGAFFDEVAESSRQTTHAEGPLPMLEWSGDPSSAPLFFVAMDRN